MSILTEKEKYSVSRMIDQKPGLINTFVEYYCYLLPSLAMAIYSIIVQDFVAAIVAFCILFIMVVFYLVYAEHYSKDLRSALKKYETEINALG